MISVKVLETCDLNPPCEVQLIKLLRLIKRVNNLSQSISLYFLQITKENVFKMQRRLQFSVWIHIGKGSVTRYVIV